MSKSFKATLFKVNELNNDDKKVLFNGIQFPSPSILRSGKEGDELFIWQMSAIPLQNKQVVYPDQEITIVDGNTTVKCRHVTWSGEVVEEFEKKLHITVIVNRPIIESDLNN